MSAWRLLKLEVNDAFTNMAIDEAIMKARIKGTVPNTLRFYQWKPSAVTIGRFQNVFQEVHIENCKKQRVDVVRRITGGGVKFAALINEMTEQMKALGKEKIKAENEKLRPTLEKMLARKKK